MYIIGGVLYFLYTLHKKSQENKDKKQPVVTGNSNPPQKPVSPPVAKPLREVMQQAKKAQADYEAQRRRAAEALKPTQVAKPASSDTDVIRTLEKAGRQEVEMEKQTSPVMVAAEINEMDLLHADSYKHKEEETQQYEIDARQAFIGSIIFEQKF